MRFLLSFIVSILIASSAFAGIVTKEIDYKDGDVHLRGTLAYDDSMEGKRPGVVLYPEWWGHNDYIKKRAKEMAEQGYVAFAADMYGVDKVTGKAEEAQAWATPFYENRTMMRKRAQAALNVLKDQKNVDRKKIAAVGFCMGGTVALELARAGTPLKGVVAFHAGLKFPGKVATDRVNSKILVVNGANDPMVPHEERQKFVDEMQNAGADLQFVLYSGAQHAFTNPAANKYAIKGVAYDSRAERRALREMKAFFAEIFG